MTTISALMSMNSTMITENSSDSNSIECVFSVLDDCELTILLSKVLFPVTILIIVIGVVANTLVLGVIIVFREMHNIPSVYIANLAITDIMFLVFVAGSNCFEYYIGAFQPEGHYTELSSFVYYMGVVTAMATVLMLAALTMDRFLAIVYPIRSRNVRSKKLAIAACIGVWIFCFAIGGIYFGAAIQGNMLEIWKEPLGKYLVSLGTVFTFVLPLLIIYFCYSAILRAIWKRRLTDERASTETQKKRARVKFAVLRASFMVVMLFTVINGIYNVLFLWIAFGGSRYVEPATVVIMFNVAQTLLHLNSLINPFLYALSHEKFYHYIWQVLRCRCQQCRLRRSQIYEPSKAQAPTVSVLGGGKGPQDSWRTQGVYNLAYENANKGTQDEISTRL